MTDEFRRADHLPADGALRFLFRLDGGLYMVHQEVRRGEIRTEVRVNVS